MTEPLTPRDVASTRRSFLKHAAIVAGAGLVAGAAAGESQGARRKIPGLGRGKGPRPPKEGETIRMAVIGVGGMGQGHAEAFAGFGARGEADVTVAAVADVNDLHAGQAVERIMKAGQAETPDTTRDYREILAREDIHAVLIATPEHAHGRPAMDAIVAGKDVYCEKPMCLRLDEAMALRETIAANPDVMFIVGTQKIMLPKYIAAKRLIEEGAIGTPVLSQASYCRNTPDGEWNYYNIDPKWEPGKNLDWDAWLAHLAPRAWDPKVYIRWRRYRDFSTGIVGDLLVHEMTPLMMTLESCGWPVHVVATGSHLVDKEMENHDVVSLNVRFENGHTMMVTGATCNEVGLENMIRGSKANIYLNSRHCVVRPERAYADYVEAQEVECPEIGSDHDAIRKDWLNAVRTRVQPPSTVDLATKVMVAVDLATRSIWDGHGYSFDPGTMTASRL